MKHAISFVTNTEINNVGSYIEEIRNDIWLKNFISNNLLSSSYPKDIKVEFSRRICWYAIARTIKPKIIVETGVHNGVGSCLLARALMKNCEDGFKGYYYGTDIDKSAGQFFRTPLNEFGEIIYGDSIDTLSKLKCKIDLFINDSDHSADYEMNEYHIIKEKLSTNAIILGDNSHVTDCLSKFSAINKRSFVFIPEKPRNHWYPGAGIGVSFSKINKD